MNILKLITAQILCLALFVAGCTTAQQTAVTTGVATLADDLLTGASTAQIAADGGSTVASLAQSYLGLTIPTSVLSDALDGSGLNLTSSLKADLASVITPTTISNLWAAVDQLYTQAESGTSTAATRHYFAALKYRTRVGSAFWYPLQRFTP